MKNPVLKILWVDDEVLMIKMYKEFFEKIANVSGFFTDISPAQSAQTAIKKLQTQKIDLLITDRHLGSEYDSHVRGTDLIKMIRNGEIISEDGISPSLPIILTTSSSSFMETDLYNRHENDSSAVHRDFHTNDKFTYFLTKPFKLVEIFDVIRVIQEELNQLTQFRIPLIAP